MTEVAIIGAGHVGLVLAHSLALKGRKVRLIDRADAPADEPGEIRFGTGGRRMFRSLGLERAVAALAGPGGALPRAGLEALLRDRLDHFRDIRIDWGQQVIGLTTDEDGVLLTCASAASRTFLRAGWVVGCDGAASFTRDWIGCGTRTPGDGGVTLARCWSRDRVFIAGAAAHHAAAASGTGDGLWDAANLGWKLGRVLCGELPVEVLASYQTEREPQVEALRLHDDAPPLGPGIAAGGEVLRGTLFPPLALADGTGLEEGRDYRPFLVLSCDSDETTLSAFEHANIDVIPRGHPEIESWLAKRGVVAALVRPDGAILGTVDDPADLSALLPVNWRIAAE